MSNNERAGIWVATETEIAVPVLTNTTEEAMASMGGSYVLADSGLADAISPAPSRAILQAMHIHPDCMMLTQDAPKLYIQTRRNLSSQDIPSITTLVEVGETWFLQAGYNVAVTGGTTGVVFTGIPGGGQGKRPGTPSPFTDITDEDGLVEQGTAGLRSINGIGENVRMSEYLQVGAATTGNPGITISFENQTSQ